jgi:hypothetical protein
LSKEKCSFEANVSLELSNRCKCAFLGYFLLMR